MYHFRKSSLIVFELYILTVFWLLTSLRCRLTENVLFSKFSDTFIVFERHKNSR